MYDGTNYVGWQRQPDGVSVQALVEGAVRTMTGEDAAVIGASRTDAGVHALGQVAHFETESAIPAENFRKGLNSLLPPDIGVIGAEDAPEGFHARKDARSKRYIYRVIVSPERQPLLLHRAWHLRIRPDLERMREASACLVGRHDFASFRAAGAASRDAVRTIGRLEIKARVLSEIELAGEGEAIDVIVEGDGFVRHMVRNIVGSLVDVGTGKLVADDVGRILAARERIEAGRCAPACGLYLVRVFY